MRRLSFSLSLRKRVGVRGWASAILFHRKPRLSGKVRTVRPSHDPLTPALFRREREQA